MDVIIQARLSSKRLPSKVLKKVLNKSLLEYQIERLKNSQFKNNIIISTSNNKTDDKLVSFCKKNKIKFFRGDLNNVSLRILDTIKKFKLKSFIRICGDSPLIDVKIIDKLIKTFKSKKFDLVTNKFPRSFPVGQSVEIIDAKAYQDSMHLIKTKEDKEHVTLHFYKYPNLFKIKNIKNSIDYSKICHSVDTIDHFKTFKKFVENNGDLYKYISFKKLIDRY